MEGPINGPNFVISPFTLTTAKLRSAVAVTSCVGIGVFGVTVDLEDIHNDFRLLLLLTDEEEEEEMRGNNEKEVRTLFKFINP